MASGEASEIRIGLPQGNPAVEPVNSWGGFGNVYDGADKIEFVKGLVEGLGAARIGDHHPAPGSRGRLSRFAAKVTGLERAFKAQEHREHVYQVVKGLNNALASAHGDGSKIDGALVSSGFMPGRMGKELADGKLITEEVANAINLRERQ